jgi:4-amino-4-deoxy-L-arabinose transferase-like glycosyltransferase
METHLQIKANRLLEYLLVIDLLFGAILLGPQGSVKAFLSPWLVFFLPGAAVMGLFRKGYDKLSTFLAGSILVGILINFTVRTLMWHFSIVVSPVGMVVAFSLGAGAVLAVAIAGEYDLHLQTTILLDRQDLYLILLVCGAYAAAASFVLLSPYTPTPDELRYSLYARLLNLNGSFPLSAPNSVFAVDFLVSRPLWIFTLATYVEASSATTQSAPMIGTFFLIVLVVATYKAADSLFGKRVALTSSVILALSPSLLVWSFTVLLDIPFASFLLLGYGSYLVSLRMTEGRVVGLRALPFAMAIACFCCAFLTKSINPVFFVPIYFHFLYSVRKSTLRFRAWLLTVLVSLPAAYLALDAADSYFTFVAPNAAIHSELVHILPVTFIGPFFALFHSQLISSGFASSVSPTSVIEGLYYAILSPFTITYPIIFLFLAGLLYAAKEEGLVRTHFTLGISIALVTSLVSSILLQQSLILRQDLFLIPIILIFAAEGIHIDLGKKFPRFLFLSAAVVAIILWVELQLFGTGGVSLGILPGPNQYTLSVYSVNFLLGIGIIIWMALGYARGRVGGTRVLKVLPRSRTGWPVALGLVVLVSVSQFAFFANADPLRSNSSFQELDAWLNKSIHPGDVIMTNYQPTLLSLLNASTLRLVNSSEFRILPVPGNVKAFVDLTVNSTYRYVVLFNSSEYEADRSLANLTEEETWTHTVLETPMAYVGTPSTTQVITVFSLWRGTPTINGGDRYLSFLPSSVLTPVPQFYPFFLSPSLLKSNITTANLHVNFSYYAENLGKKPYEPIYLKFNDSTVLVLSVNPLKDNTPGPGYRYVSIPRSEGKWVNVTVDIGSAVENAFGRGVIKHIHVVVFRLQDASPAILKVRNVTFYYIDPATSVSAAITCSRMSSSGSYRGPCS